MRKETDKEEKAVAGQSTWGEKLLIYGEYPHSLMQHILTLLRIERKGAEWLITEEFLQKYFEKYRDFSREIAELQIAKKRGLLNGFVDRKRSKDEEKKSFIQNSLPGLLEELREFEAAELLESLMWVFGWEITVEVVRKWEVSAEDRANFHNFDELEMFQRSRNPLKEDEISEAPTAEEKKTSGKKK
ncbi:MAG: hypothetical protein IJ733_15015, partial [Lachnospiraceae bacterium]|nr:hypothetical protein [Lachnospiraceae bacterium]